MSRYGRKRGLEWLDECDHEIIEAALDRIGMLDHKNDHFGSLSGGQRQRVLIARALALKPKILILDEPSTGLDVVAQDRFYKILQTIRDEESMTILVVSHDIGAVSSVVDHIACLNRKIHFHGKPHDRSPLDALDKVFGKHVHFLMHDETCETCEKP
jgi:zinc transport system ATP-binding protein